MKKKRVLLIILLMFLFLSLSGCAFLKSELNSLKGSLIGVSYIGEFYDNYGVRFLTVTGENIDIDGKALYIHRANFEIIDRDLIN